MSDTRWVVLDVGETLVDETRVFRTWAEIFGLPEFTLMAVLGGSISNANDADGWRRFFELIQHPDWQDSRPDFERGMVRRAPTTSTPMRSARSTA